MHAMTIRVERNVDKQRLDAMGVAQWPTWGKGRSTFPWHYDKTETSYIIRGEVVVTPADGPAVVLRAGDLVIFPAGLSCHWEIREDLLKHYNFS